MRHTQKRTSSFVSSVVSCREIGVAKSGKVDWDIILMTRLRIWDFVLKALQSPFPSDQPP